MYARNRGAGISRIAVAGVMSSARVVVKDRSANVKVVHRSHVSVMIRDVVRRGHRVWKRRRRSSWNLQRS